MTPLGTPDLTSRQLQTVLALAEYGSFIAAASLLKTSQPAVTRTIKHVEDVLGIKLFDRSTRSVQITDAGKEFVAVAARVLNDLKITLRSMRELSDQRRGQIIISSIMSVANGKLPGLVSAYRLDHPGIELHVRDGVHGTVIEDVRSGGRRLRHHLSRRFARPVPCRCGSAAKTSPSCFPGIMNWRRRRPCPCPT